MTPAKFMLNDHFLIHLYQYSTGMPPVDKSPCSVGQQLARSEDKMCNTQIPGIDAWYWTKYLEGIYTWSATHTSLLPGHLKQLSSLKL